jgi:hypothetical protein
MTLYSPLGLNQHLLIFTGAFFAVLGITALLVVKNTDRKINKAVIDASKSLIHNTEVLISKEKMLRKLDHTFRMMILVDALKIVKRISNTQFSQYPNSYAARRAKAQISKSIDKLVQSMSVDVNIVLKEMLEETDERKQL